MSGASGDPNGQRDDATNGVVWISGPGSGFCKGGLVSHTVSIISYYISMSIKVFVQAQYKRHFFLCFCRQFLFSFILACDQNGQKEASDLFLGRRILASFGKPHPLGPGIIELEGGPLTPWLFFLSLLAKGLFFSFFFLLTTPFFG